ncbi:hypothetical protein [Rugamonas aquatica]|uniref:Uncharacterized protein n=1 Tax=Rugamonas aquatica TaxID=2743357 RepID=A0A6A7MZD8_9BURK|nr:hypothetical protein [Rugamonas aquatica]MQA38122.1 hypothetical protein [Rugamonas aquatica]
MFNDISSEELREICQRVSDRMRAELSVSPPKREKYFFHDWPCAKFTSEEIRAALNAAWKKTFEHS